LGFITRQSYRVPIMRSKPELPPIVVVDDCANDIFLLQQRFADAKIVNPVSTFADAQAALAYLQRAGAGRSRRKDPMPCLILIDVNMPGISGLKLLDRVRQQPAFNAVTVMLLSDSDAPYDVEIGYASGADKYLFKHPSPTVLREIVTAAMVRFDGGKKLP
jgi:CheY-like chemotaxis protein